MHQHMKRPLQYYDALKNVNINEKRMQINTNKSVKASCM